MKHQLAKYIVLFCVISGLGLLATDAMATVAANTQIINQATLSYNDGTGVQTENASVAVTVSLVPGLATLDSPADQSSVYTGANTTHTYTYTITAGGNGPDTYAVTTAVAGSTNTTGAGTGGDTSFPLGATVTTSGSTTTVLQVPSDGTADSSVNGIENGDTVVVNGEVRTVSGISDPASGTATITLGVALGAAPGAGVSVHEQRTFPVDVLSGTITTVGTDITVTADTTVTNSAGPATDQILSTYTSGQAVLDKYVRNLTDAAGNAGGAGAQSFTVNGATNDYYTGGVTGETGDVLEYVLVASNNGGAQVTACSIADVLPTAFITFNSDAYGVSQDFAYIDEGGSETNLTEDPADDAATLSGANLTVNVGAGATSGAGGTIDPGNDVRVAYQVTID
jgi:hypothetical protein